VTFGADLSLQLGQSSPHVGPRPPNQRAGPWPFKGVASRNVGSPESPYVDWHVEPTVLDDLTNTVVIGAFEGWNDAGEAATTAVARLIARWRAKPLASIDPEEFIDFSVTRPQVELHAELRQIRWPATNLHLGRMDDGRSVVLLTGPEPQLRWRTYCREVTAILQRANVSVVVLLGALLADVPHTRPTRVTRTAGTRSLAAGYDAALSRYEGPTGIVGVLADACRVAGIDALSIWAAVPHYLPGNQSPRAALAMLEAVGDLFGEAAVPIDLHVEAAAFDRQVGEVVDADDDMRHYVSQLEERFDEGDSDDDVDDDDDDDTDADIELRSPDDMLVNGSLTDAEGRPLSGDALAEELERFLRDQGRGRE
jgi:hypothetical protein